MPGPGFAAMQSMMQTNLWVDAIYTFIIILVCGIIYAKTRELYALTGHKGIHYFRNVFLFFALSYFFSFLVSAPRLWRDVMYGRFIVMGLLSSPFMPAPLQFCILSTACCGRRRISAFSAESGSFIFWHWLLLSSPYCSTCR